MARRLQPAARALASAVPLWYHASVPRKVRELAADLLAAGYHDRGGKGSHRNFTKPGSPCVTLSGKPGDDAKPYQERDVRRAVEGLKP